MRILHFTESTASRFGGPPRFVADACRLLAAEGHPSTIMTMDPTDLPTAWLDRSASRSVSLPRIVTLGAPATRGLFFGPAEMARIRVELRMADVLHLHNIWSPLTLQVAAAARSLGVPYVVSLHGMLDDWSIAQGNLKKRLFLSVGGRHFLEHAACVHCTAQAEVDQSKKWFPAGHETIVPYLMDLAPYRDLPGPELARKRFPQLANGAPTALFLSRLHYKKGPEYLIRAAAELKARSIECTIALAGTGDDAYVNGLKALARDLKVDDGRVQFLGHVTGADKLSLYQASDLFVLPTSQENFGLVLVEALACGTPVITTKGVDIWRDVESSGAAEIRDREPKILADGIAGVACNPERRAAMSASARPWVFETYDEGRLFRRFENLYAEASASMAPTSGRGADERVLAEVETVLTAR